MDNEARRPSWKAQRILDWGYTELIAGVDRPAVLGQLTSVPVGKSKRSFPMSSISYRGVTVDSMGKTDRSSILAGGELGTV